MELIKFKISQEPSIDRNDNSPTYGTLTATSFYVNVMLSQNSEDMGMFTNTYFIPNLSFSLFSGDSTIRATGTTVSDYYFYGNQLVTGYTDSRLSDNRSYNNNQQYVLNFDVNSQTYINYKGDIVNGVDRVTYLGNPITYVFDTDINDPNIGTTAQINGLLFRDFTGTTGGTIFSYINEGINATNTSLSAITKEEYLFGIISQPEVKSDVFIDRGQIAIFEPHLKLSEITNLDELVRYGKGYFNLIPQ